MGKSGVDLDYYCRFEYNRLHYSNNNIGDIMDTIINLFANYPAWVNALLSLCVGATAITALTPSSVDNRILGIIIKVLNVVAGNFLRNKNADDFS